MTVYYTLGTIDPSAEQTGLYAGGANQQPYIARQTGVYNSPNDNYVYDSNGSVGKINDNGSISFLNGWSSDGGDDLGNVSIFSNKLDSDGNSIKVLTVNPNDIQSTPVSPIIAQWMNQVQRETVLENQSNKNFAEKIMGAAATPEGMLAITLAALTYGGSLAAEGAIGAGEVGAGAASAGASAGTGAAVSSELAALEADAAIQAGLGASAGVAGADAVMPSALSGEVAGEGTAQLGAGTSLSADAASNPLNPYYSTANPTAQASTGTVSNLVGGGAESNLATLDSLNNPLLPTSGAGIGGSELGATGSIIGSGQGLGVQTLPETLAPTGLNGLTVNDLNSQPLLNNGTSSSITGKDVADALRAANSANNLIKGLTSSQQKLATNQQNLQQSQALGNLLKTNQFTPTATPEVYKAQNPFTFGQQEPIQGNPLASLLRNNYGNS